MKTKIINFDKYEDFFCLACTLVFALVRWCCCCCCCCFRTSCSFFVCKILLLKDKSRGSDGNYSKYLLLFHIFLIITEESRHLMGADFLSSKPNSEGNQIGLTLLRWESKTVFFIFPIPLIPVRSECLQHLWFPLPAIPDSSLTLSTFALIHQLPCRISQSACLPASDRRNQAVKQ